MATPNNPKGRPWQVNFQTVTLTQAANVAAATYPVLNPAGAAGTKIFQKDVVLLGCLLSATFITAAALERAMIALAPNGRTAVAATGDSSVYLQLVLRSVAAASANQLIQRNAGTMFSPPFMPLIPGGSGVQLYGTDQTSLDWDVHCTVYYITLPQYQQLVGQMGYGR